MYLELPLVLETQVCRKVLLDQSIQSLLRYPETRLTLVARLGQYLRVSRLFQGHQGFQESLTVLPVLSNLAVPMDPEVLVIRSVQRIQ